MFLERLRTGTHETKIQMKTGASKEISNRSGVAHGVTAGMCLTADGTMMERVYKVMEIQRKAGLCCNVEDGEVDACQDDQVVDATTLS